MAAITESIYNQINSNMMASSAYYHCRRPSSLSASWQFGKRPKKRHSSSLSLFDSSLFGVDITETNSLPSTPLAFVPLDEGRKTRAQESVGCDSDITNFLSTSSASSGYYSGFSEPSSIGSSPYSCSTSPSFSYFLFSRENSSDNEPVTTIPLDQPTTDNVLAEPVTTGTNHLNNSWSSLTDAFSSRIATTSPHTDATTTSGTIPTDSSHGSPSKLTSVFVPEKRRNSNSSTNGSSLTDDVIRHRVKDEEGFIRRAACLCVNEDESKVVLISSKNEGGGWLVPGGGLESGEGEAEAAEREAWEEAGITGSVKRYLGVFQSEDEVTHKKKRTAVYVLTVHEQHSEFPEASLGRVREWFSIDTAVHHLSRCKPHQIAYLRAL